MNSERTLTTWIEGGTYFECPRWHDGRWWVSDFYRHGVFSYDDDGREELEVEVEGQPSGLGWLPDGDLLVVSMKDRRVLRRAADGTVIDHADVSELTTGHLNDMIVDRQGRAYAGNFGFDLMGGGHPATGQPRAHRPRRQRRHRRGGPVVSQRHGDHRRRHADRRRDVRGPPHRVRHPARRRRSTDRRVWAQVQPSPEPGDTEAMLGAVTLRSRRLRAGRRGPRVGGQRARRAVCRVAPGGRDRRRGRDARRASASSPAGSAARTAGR